MQQRLSPAAGAGARTRRRAGSARRMERVGWAAPGWREGRPDADRADAGGCQSVCGNRMPPDTALSTERDRFLHLDKRHAKTRRPRWDVPDRALTVAMCGDVWGWGARGWWG